MIENLPIILMTYDTAAKALKAFSTWISQAKGDCRSIIEELKENSRYFYAVLEEDASLAKAFSKLSTKEYDRLMKEGFDFNSLKKKKIGKFPELDGTDLSSWQGKNTQDLVTNIYDKIKDIKEIWVFVKSCG
jgi:hypothetical protein